MMGDLVRSRRNWKAVAHTALVISVVLAGGFILQARRATVVPYVVEVDALGEMRTLGALAAAAPPERAILAALRRVVSNMRTMPSDARLLNVQLHQAQAFLAGDALQMFTQEVRTQSDKMQQMLRRGRTRYVEEVSSILKVPGESNVYRVAWRETADAGGVSEARGYEGHFKVTLMAPGAPEVLLENPLGIFVTDYTWSATGSRP